METINKISQAILSGQKTIVINGKEITLPVGQKAGTYTQQRSYAMLKANKLITIMNQQKDMLKEFIKETKKNNGATYNLITGELNPQKGYFVGVEGKKYDLKNIGLDIQNFVTENSIKLSDKQKFVGSWIEKGALYLDIVLMFEDLEEAVNEGLKNKEIAIYDANNKKTIEL